MNINGTIYNILEWITKFAYINLLWILFTVVGGILLGFFPATIAMFAIIRKWLRGDTEIRLLTTFWNIYKKDFWKSNKLGLFIYAIACLVVIDIYFLQSHINEQLVWIQIPLFAFMLLFLLFLFYIFPTFVHFDLKVIQLIKQAFLIMLINPVHNFLMLVTLGSLYIVMSVIPALALIYAGSSYAFITMWISLKSFSRVHKNE
ncbi:YesL family protein [Salipaludibacillus sp. HK11]|uniref:YesL family protein n=1 Tax=Salipaludibacillus sp. HK11 TaxID=3394320 RepID=UPI0039FC3661